MTVYRLALVGLLGIALVSAAQDTATLTLTRDGTDRGKFDSLELRPNTKQPFFVVVTNIAGQRTSYFVEIEGLKGTPLKIRESITLEDKESKTIAFKPPPPPKKEEPPKTPAEAKKEAAAAAQPEPPAGVPVQFTNLEGNERGFAFKVRVLKQDGTTLAAGERTVKITVQHPLRYMKEPDVTLEGAGRRRDLTALMATKSRKADDATAPEVDFVPPVNVRFAFPPQLGLKVSDLRAGSYERDLARSAQQVTMKAENLPYLIAADVPVKFHFNVDRYPRAFTYTSNVRRDIATNSAANKETRDTKAAVRLFPIGTSPRIKALEPQIVSGTLTTPKFATLPTKELRFRVEVDNEAAGSTLVLRVARNGTRVRPATDLDPDEVVDLGLPKETRVWLDPAGPDGAVVVANLLGDHTASVDVSALRGPHEVQGVLLEPNPTDPAGKPKETLMSMTVVVDDTPPPAEDIRIGTFPNRLVRGQPLPVVVSTSDPETEIVRVGVVLGKPGPDGKLPPDAPTTFAEPTPLGWVAQMPVPLPPPPPPAPPPPAPPPKKEPVPPFDITIVAENEVGLSTAKVIRIELVEPKGGTIEVKVERGGRPQGGTPVTLRDVAGAEKGVGTTNEKGIVLFKNLPPGVYKMTALKEDSSLGLAGIASAQIQDPPEDKPVPVVLTLVKRR